MYVCLSSLCMSFLLPPCLSPDSLSSFPLLVFLNVCLSFLLYVCLSYFRLLLNVYLSFFYMYVFLTSVCFSRDSLSSFPLLLNVCLSFFSMYVFLTSVCLSPDSLSSFPLLLNVCLSVFLLLSSLVCLSRDSSSFPLDSLSSLHSVSLLNVCLSFFSMYVFLTSACFSPVSLSSFLC
ncbi:unnamed protein product [Acanthosepion pharaonis]|uniref:NADH dehydrogenase subunit 6 n=1 Tax=Acanthosepion pharaonis TaxID=158019 RepID=A0A812BB42_ACAPH|nr:unnamed protein product [Sepia pharaonis]